jgi:hypothetical protein
LQPTADPAKVRFIMHCSGFYAFWFFGFPLSGGLSPERVQP